MAALVPRAAEAGLQMHQVRSGRRDGFGAVRAASVKASVMS
jgi:hypothetical protein